MWQSLMCLVLHCNSFKPDLLRGDTITVTSIENRPFLIVEDPSAAGNAKYSGYLVDLVDKLGDKLGASFNINLVKDGRYGYCNSSEEYCEDWNGMIGEVMRGEADIAVADLTVAPKRITAVDFSQSFMTGGLVVLARKDAPDSVTGLVDEGYTFVGVRGGSTQKLFETSEDPLHVRMRDNMEFSANSMDEILEMMKSSDKKVMLSEVAKAKYYANKESGFKVLPEQLNSVNYGIAIAKGAAKRDGGSVYDIKRVLDYAISTLKYDGQLASLERKWFPTN